MLDEHLSRAAGHRTRLFDSLTGRIVAVAAVWIVALLLIGGFALDRVLSRSMVDSFDNQLVYLLNSLVASAEIGPAGEIRSVRPLADQRFLQPYSGLYFQISDVSANHCQKQTYDEALCYPSRSLWDRRLRVDTSHRDARPHLYDSDEFSADEVEPLRIAERDAVLPGSPVRWRFEVAESRATLNGEIRRLRTILIRSFGVLGIGLLLLVALQTLFGLWPLRRVRKEVAGIRSGETNRVSDHFPAEIRPLVEEINELLEHSEAQAEEARRHAGNLAHALKTPLTVITNAATALAPDLADTVCREANTMRRQVNHHLARARALGRRAATQSRARVWESLEAVQRAVEQLHEGITVDIAGDHQAEVRVERQDLDEMLGNLVENAAKYGAGRVFVTVQSSDGTVSVLVEDDGLGIPNPRRGDLFTRGARLDTTGKPGTGLGLAIVRDVAEIYGGCIRLEQSEDLGGLLARLTLRAA